MRYLPTRACFFPPQGSADLGLGFCGVCGSDEIEIGTLTWITNFFWTGQCGLSYLDFLSQQDLHFFLIYLHCLLPQLYCACVFSFQYSQQTPLILAALRLVLSLLGLLGWVVESGVSGGDIRRRRHRRNFCGGMMGQPRLFPASSSS